MKFNFHYGKGGACVAVALLAFSASLSARADYPSTVLSQTPATYWRLNETTAPQPPPIVATNLGTVGIAGNGEYRDSFPGALPGAIAADSTDGAARMPGVVDGNRVRIPFQPEWNQTGPFSVEFWAKPGQTAALECPAASVEFIAAPVQRNGWLIYQGDSTLANGNGWVFRQYNSTGLASQSGVAVNMPLDTSKWYHIVATFDGTTLRLYTNGVLGGSTALAGTARANTNSAIPFTFGSRADGASGFFVYRGLIDEGAMYTGALSAARVLAHYQAGTNAASSTYSATVQSDSPAGYWRFNEQGAPPAANIGSLGSAANGSYVYNAQPNQAGPDPSSVPTAFPGFASGNKAVLFDGTSGSVNIPALNLNTNALTVTAWIKPNGGQLAKAGIFYNQGLSSVAGLQINAAGGFGLAYNWNNGSGVNWNSGVNLTDSEWNFAALVIQPDKAILYVPGQPPATNSALHAPLVFDGLSFIGAGGANFNGTIDEVAVFTRALSIGEAYSQYASAVGGLAPQIFADPVAPANPVYTGDTLNLVVDAGGTPTLSYQWRKDTAPIAGATTSAYSKSNVTGADTGTYDVVVTNLYGNVTSAGAAITVNTLVAPSITQGPVGRTLYPGGTLNLTVVATGGALAYQWSRNGSPIAGATTSAYFVSSVTTNHGGSYTVSVTNNLGSATGGPVIINVPTLTNGTFAAVIAADAPVAWWRLDETSGNILYDAMGHHDGFYSNSNGGMTLGAGGAISNGFSGTAPAFTGTADFGYVPYSPALNAQDFTIECWALESSVSDFRTPVSSHEDPKAGYGFRTQASKWYGFIGLNDVNYVVPTGATPETDAQDDIVANQWKHLMLVYSAGTALRFYINGLWDGNAYVNFTRNGSGAFIIGGLGHGATGPDSFWLGRVDEVAYYNRALAPSNALAHYNAGVFIPGVAPVVAVQPPSQTAVVGSNVTFSATVGGTSPFGYQWLKNGTPIAGQTTLNLTLTNVYYTDAGNYQLRATNSVGTNTSAIATLFVVPPAAFANVTNSLVVHLKFDGTYADSSGRGNNASPQGIDGGLPSFVPGKVGANALHYFTLTDLATVPSVTNNGYAVIGATGTPVADMQFGTSQDFSVAYWVKLPVGYVGGDLPFLCSTPDSLGGFGVCFAPSYGGGSYGWSLGHASSTGRVRVEGPDNAINNGAWHHLVHTFSRTGNGITYLDGAVVNTTDISGAGDIDFPSEFDIGQASAGVYAEQGSGDIDDIGVWRRVLTQAEALNIYQAGQNAGRSFDTYGPVSLQIRRSGNNLEIIWQAGTLLESTSINGPWTPVSGATAPYYTVPLPSSGNKFYKVQL